MIRFFILNSFLLSWSWVATAQAPEAQSENSLQGGTISEQFDYINQVSSNYQEYKVIKRVDLNQLQSNILDSIGQYQNKIQALNTELGQNESRISALDSELEDTKAANEQAVRERDSFSFFGFLLQKGLYNTLMWGLVIFLTLILLISYFRFKRSHKITSETQHNLDDLREEYEQHRRNTLERERKLNRQLVDALNKKDS
ncbi:MAG: hypothetical protein WDZ72_07155 [Cyclobacteriaceae bacterium]